MTSYLEDGFREFFEVGVEGENKAERRESIKQVFLAGALYALSVHNPETHGDLVAEAMALMGEDDDEEGGDGERLTVTLSQQVQRKTEDDPRAAEAMREFIANLHQARDAVDKGKYASMDDAIEAITGVRPEPIGEGEWRRIKKKLK